MVFVILERTCRITVQIPRVCARLLLYVKSYTRYLAYPVGVDLVNSLIRRKKETKSDVEVACLLTNLSERLKKLDPVHVQTERGQVTLRLEQLLCIYRTLGTILSSKEIKLLQTLYIRISDYINTGKVNQFAMTTADEFVSKYIRNV